MSLNYKHLHYFWATAKAGGLVRAAERLHLSPQTLSGQIKLLEDQLGCALFAKEGRGLALTPAGETALTYADQIFTLGDELEAALQPARRAAHALDFRVGLADSVPKAIAYRLLEPALDTGATVRLLCSEGPFADLLAALAVRRLDLVIADEPMNRQIGLKAFNHALGTTAMSFFGAPTLVRGLKGQFPSSLDGAPMLMQGARSAMRRRLEGWLSERQLQVQVVGEFDDAALLKAFGREGRGVFMAPTVLEEDTCNQYGVQVIGRSEDLVEEFYAVSVERRITHPCVAAITQAARGRLFHA